MADYHGETAVHKAIRSSDVAALRVLLECKPQCVAVPSFEGTPRACLRFHAFQLYGTLSI